MQKWEYLIEHGIDSDDSLEQLNNLGDEGWELCGELPAVDLLIGARIDYVFKRPKQ